MGAVGQRGKPRNTSRHDWGTGVVAGFCVLAVAFVVWVFTHHGAGKSADLIGDGAFLPINLAAALLAVRAARRHGTDAASRRAWMRIGAAFASWWLGDCLWFYFEVIKHTQPSPSVADIGYLAFYPLLFWGLVSLPAARRQKGDLTKLLLDASTVLVGTALLVWYLVVGTIVHHAGVTLGETVLNVAYPAGDLMLIFGLAVVLVRRPSASFAPAMRILVAAVALFVVADVAYTHMSLTGSYTSGSWPDAFWMVAQVLLLFAAQRQYLAARQVDETPLAAVVPRVIPVPSVSKLPYFGIVLGYGLLVTVGWREAVYPLGDLLFGSVILTGLVVTRQVGALRENVRLLTEMHELAITDSLTGLHTRRSFADAAAAEMEDAAERSMAVIMIDVDHFKLINDTYGHTAGDTVLQEAAVRCRGVLRAGDVLARYGGDEMVALLPGSDAHVALIIADRIRRELSGRAIETPYGPVNVTLSIGVAAGTHTSTEELLRRADVALYDAKDAGRDCARAFALQVSEPAPRPPVAGDSYETPLTPTNAPIA
jgi:diguanylate cyclase (GGDEF)-like protein